MLHWQHKNEQARIQFWMKLGAIVLFFHICVLGYLLFVSNVYNVYHVAFNASRLATQAPVVFMPLYKRIQSEKSSEVCNKTSDVAKKKKTQSLAKANKGNSTVISAEPKTGAKKHVAKKMEQKTSTKKTSQESVKQHAKKEVIKVPAQKEQVKDAISSLPLVEQKQIDQKQEIKPQTESKKAQKHTEALKVPKDIKNNAGTVEQVSDKTSPIYLGQQEWYALQVQEALQAELAKHWNVPAGLSPGLACQVAVVVSRQGMIEKVRVIESSGVLAFDISARTAASKMQLPFIARGKEFVITFKQ